MRNFLNTGLFLIMLLSTAFTFAQYRSLLRFPQRLPQQPFYISLYYQSTVDTDTQSHVPQIEQQVRYGSFFCDLELKSVKKLGVMIKFHAGDYDRYMQKTIEK